jgi:hypothetical protein
LRGENVKPVLQALVLAERVYEEKEGRKIIEIVCEGEIIGSLRLLAIDATNPQGS